MKPTNQQASGKKKKLNEDIYEELKAQTDICIYVYVYSYMQDKIQFNIVIRGYMEMQI